MRLYLVIALSVLAGIAAPRALAIQANLSGKPSPIWQTNDIVWTLATSNGVVYAGGQFTSVRPPGSAAGTGEVARGRLAAFNASTGATTDAAGTTLVISQVTGACAACHDAPAAINHMTLNGGLFYAPRSTAIGPGAQPEQCLICHGPGRTAAIGAVHQR